ncbi:MAG: MerR family transcriptional regulator [Candidatus Bipolaricaulia bacterium]
MPTLKTGEVAERAGVNIHTVRYYEERDLLPPVPRSAAGHRQFTGEHLAHIRFVKRAQELGFTLEEIRELLSLRADPEAGEEVREKTEEKIEEVRGKIRDLQRIEEKLTELAEACEEHGGAEDCLVLHALEGETEAY